MKERTIVIISIIIGFLIFLALEALFFISLIALASSVGVAGALLLIPLALTHQTLGGLSISPQTIMMYEIGIILLSIILTSLIYLLLSFINRKLSRH